MLVPCTKESKKNKLKKKQFIEGLRSVLILNDSIIILFFIKVNMSPIQQAILVGLGLKHKTVDRYRNIYFITWSSYMPNPMLYYGSLENCHLWFLSFISSRK